MASFNVWVEYFAWNLKGTFWKFTQNIFPIHWKLCIFITGEYSRDHRFNSSWAFWNTMWPGYLQVMIIICYHHNFQHILSWVFNTRLKTKQRVDTFGCSNLCHSKQMEHWQWQYLLASGKLVTLIRFCSQTSFAKYTFTTSYLAYTMNTLAWHGKRVSMA